MIQTTGILDLSGYWNYVMVLWKKVASKRTGSQVWYYQFTKRKGMHACMHVCACVCGGAHMCACVCACVRVPAHPGSLNQRAIKRVLELLKILFVTNCYVLRLQTAIENLNSDQISHRSPIPPMSSNFSFVNFVLIPRGRLCWEPISFSAQICKYQAVTGLMEFRCNQYGVLSSVGFEHTELYEWFIIINARCQVQLHTDFQRSDSHMHMHAFQNDYYFCQLLLDFIRIRSN